eukprot:TRINITY_DN18832_c0_g1_i1.p1 TRINITY_DN18832_c0_g1~~TRINITY_DN18832_c0_g1_i1.p1  ORF type:complete len:110 (-),score=21.62 TRINITY_DN18832_c0_g1_i1:242-571(-)
MSSIVITPVIETESSFRNRSVSLKLLNCSSADECEDTSSSTNGNKHRRAGKKLVPRSVSAMSPVSSNRFSLNGIPEHQVVLYFNDLVDQTLRNNTQLFEGLLPPQKPMV